MRALAWVEKRPRPFFPASVNGRLIRAREGAWHRAGRPVSLRDHLQIRACGSRERNGVMGEFNIDPLELAALVASRVCHDIISPVGAIVNGLEVLEEEKDESMREFAMDLVQKSARQASAKLQFSRLAFGASGGAGAEIDMADAGRC